MKIRQILTCKILPKYQLWVGIDVEITKDCKRGHLHILHSRYKLPWMNAKVDGLSRERHSRISYTQIEKYNKWLEFTEVFKCRMEMADERQTSKFMLSERQGYWSIFALLWPSTWHRITKGMKVLFQLMVSEKGFVPLFYGFLHLDRTSWECEHVAEESYLAHSLL